MRKLFYGLLMILVGILLVGCASEPPFVGTWHEDYFGDDGADYNNTFYHNLTFNDDGTFENNDTVMTNDTSNIYRNIHQSGSYSGDNGSFFFNVSSSSGGYKKDLPEPQSPLDDRDPFNLERTRFKRRYTIDGDTLTLYENEEQDPVTSDYFKGTYHRGRTVDCPKLNAK